MSSQHNNVLTEQLELGSSGPEEDIFEEDGCYSPTSSVSSCMSSSSATVLLPTVTTSFSSSSHTAGGKVLCTSCNQEISDRYLLQVNNYCWHVRCLSCSVCQTSLGRHVSCYIKEQQVFCKLDYFRKYGTRCARCGRNIRSSDWVRRARGSTFHLACFSCSSCKRQLNTGEEFGLMDDKVFCRGHYDNMLDNIKRAQDSKRARDEDVLPSGGQHGASTISRPAKRARTSFTVDQLQVMQTQFSKDNNPDAQTLQKLAERTGLSRRVIQVWFQNCRARQKKHTHPVSCTVMTSLPAGQLAAPLIEDLHYTTFVPDTTLLTTLTYMDVQSSNGNPLLLQPIMANPMTHLPVGHA